MKKVIVLMSTYNGEKYVEEQIDSVLKQKGVDVYLRVRDDGSKDRTLEILEKYATKYKNFSYYSGENLKPAKSFLDLITTADKADYYALCDQDDYWDEDKIEVAIEKLDQMDQTLPLLYYSNLRIVDQELSYFRMAHSTPMFNHNKYSALAENLCTGCTAVFNYRAKELVSLRLPEKCTMHDAWLYMICKLMGETVYDFEAHISYRQHENNVVGTYLKANRWKEVTERIVRLFDRDLQPRFVNASSFYQCFGDMMDQKTLQKVEKVAKYKDSFGRQMSLFFDNKIKGSSLYGNFRFKVLVLLKIA